MSPSLLELGNVSGNVSMTSIIDLAMTNSIVPLRERYAQQFSLFIANHLGVEKVYFNMLNSMKGEDEKTRANAMQLFDDFAEMLSSNIHNEVNQLEEL